MKNLAILLTALLFSMTGNAGTDTLECNYETYSSQDGNQKLKDEFKLTFIIDTDKDTSYMLGNNGSTKVTLIPTKNGLSFIEITGAGNVMTTAMDRKYSSVHSRNSIIAGELLPSQYYGKCIFK